MASGTKFYPFIEAVYKGKHDFSTHTFKVMLSNTAPSQSNSQKSDITEISGGNGYTAGGATVTISSVAQSSGTLKIVIDDVVFTASGGSIATFRYAVVYNDTSTGDLLCFYWDLGSQTVTTGQSFTVDFNASTGAYTAS